MFACQKQVRDVTVTYRFIFHPHPLSQIGWISAKNSNVLHRERSEDAPAKKTSAAQ